MYWELVRRMS